MIKRLIFDLDNTLIMWRDEYTFAIKNVVEEYNLDVDYMLVDSLIEEYENYYNVYTKENLLNLVNTKLNLNVKIDFIDAWLDGLTKMAHGDKDTIDTLEYLSKKYELVVLTNGFRDSQIGRLKTSGIYKYFKEVYAGEEYIKPSLESYKDAIGPYNIDECIMIGDTYKTDIIGALNVGMRAIMITNESNNYVGNYEIIHKISELKEML